MVQSHDQNYKNLILDYPRESIEFFVPGEAAALDEQARIIPIRQEQLKQRLGDRFRELDTPLLVEWPDGRRDAIIFVFEEETQSGRFEIDRLAHYCLDIAVMYETQRIVPVVVFLRPGQYPLSLQLGSEQHTFLDFHYVACALWEYDAEHYKDSDNLVARLNLPLMHRDPTRKLALYDWAVDGLFRLEGRVEYQQKYLQFVDSYADLSDAEYREFRDEYLARHEQGDLILGAFQRQLETQRAEGRDEGKAEGELVLLERQLARRFGELPDWAVERLRSADTEQLEVWAERIFDAGSLEEFFV